MMSNKIMSIILCTIVFSCTSRTSYNKAPEKLLDNIENDSAIESLLRLSNESFVQKDDSLVNTIKNDSILRFLLYVSANVENRCDTNAVISFVKMYDDYPLFNAEIGELSNEVLYLLFLKQTNLIVNIMLTNTTNVQFKNITLELQNPICDTFDIGRITNKVREINLENQRKGCILDALEIAQKKYDGQ